MKKSKTNISDVGSNFQVGGGGRVEKQPTTLHVYAYVVMRGGGGSPRFLHYWTVRIVSNVMTSEIKDPDVFFCKGRKLQLKLQI